VLAAQYVGDQAFSVADQESVEPGPDEVRIDVAYVGICGTDLHIKHGAMDRRVDIPAVIGHEMSGRIAAVGGDVEGWAIGDAVTVMPLDWCEACAACRAGHRHVCQNLVFVGIDSPGAMQQSWTVPARLLVRLPEDLRLDHAALAEPAAVAVHDVRRSGLKAGEKALVVGGGPIGLLIALVAAAEGAEVVVSEPSAHRRAIAERLALRTLDPSDPSFDRAIDDWTEGAGAHVAFEVSGAEAGLAAAIHALAVRGRLVVVAIHNEPKPVDLFRVFWRELSVIGARVYERCDFEQAVERVATGKIPAGALISAVTPLASTAEAFKILEQGGDVMKVLIDCSPTPR
jgi:(R,R)-butanediol dehydrogenase/meso-butanediol dehydrogenase/diacetyl reductase